MPTASCRQSNAPVSASYAYSSPCRPSAPVTNRRLLQTTGELNPGRGTSADHATPDPPGMSHRTGAGSALQPRPPVPRNAGHHSDNGSPAAGSGGSGTAWPDAARVAGRSTSATDPAAAASRPM